jgi:hypothetical protein
MFVAGGRHVDRSAERAAPRVFDRLAVGENTAADSEQDHIARAVADLGDRHACRERVLDALEIVMQLGDNAELRRVARNRYLELTEDAA